MVEKNIALAYWVARKIAVKFDKMNDLDELQGEALLSLVRAGKGYDPSFGVKFSTYACRCIYNHLGKVVRKGGRLTTTSIEGEKDDTPRFEVADKVVAQEDYEIDEMVDNAIAHLEEGDREIIKSYFWGDETLEEIGTRMGVTKQWIGQKVGKITERLARMM